MNIITFLKIAFSLLLFILFIFFFGFPSWEKFQAKEVMSNKRKVNPTESITPAVTICALDKKTRQGWKYSNVKKGMGNGKNEGNKKDDITLSKYKLDILSYHCEGNELLTDCINNETFNLTETVKNANMGDYQDIFNTTYWIDELSYFGLGKCHTLNNSVSLGSSHFQFFLNRSLNYAVVIHDPNYFMLTANPSTMPYLYLDMDASQGNKLVYIEAVEYININRPDQPCNDQEHYSFTACVKTSVSATIGCR